MAARKRGLLAYGVVLGIAGIVLLAAIAPSNWMTGSRQMEMRSSIQILDQGGPPLLIHPAAPGGSRRYCAAGANDDQGSFVIVPLLGHWLGIAKPETVMRWLYLVMMGIAIVVYPLIFHRLTDSVAAGLVAPVALIATLVALSRWSTDVYWIMSWAVLMLLPLVLLLDRRCPRCRLVALALIVVAASFASSIRAHAGLGIFLAAVVVAATRHGRVLSRIAAIALLLVAYTAVTPLGLGFIRDYRNDTIGATQLSNGREDSHIFWHPAYLGLGYLPNDAGIRFDDNVGVRDALSVSRRATYGSTTYEDTLRTLFFKHARENPGEVIVNVLAKLVVVVRDAALGLLLLAILLPQALRLGGTRPLTRRALLLVTPAFVLSLLPVLLTVPAGSYLTGALAALALLCIVTLTSLLAPLPDATRVWSWVSHRHALGVACVVVMLTACALGGTVIQAKAEKWNRGATTTGPTRQALAC